MYELLADLEVRSKFDNIKLPILLKKIVGSIYAVHGRVR